MRVSFSLLLAGAIGCVASGGTGFRAVRAARCCGSMEGTSEVYGDRTGPAMPVASEHGGRAGGSGWMMLARSFPAEGNPAAEVLLPAVLGSCTGLYVAVRGIGGVDGPAHVHMVDSVVAAGITRSCLRRSGGVWRCRW